MARAEDVELGSMVLDIWITVVEAGTEAVNVVPGSFFKAALVLMLRTGIEEERERELVVVWVELDLTADDDLHTGRCQTYQGTYINERNK